MEEIKEMFLEMRDRLKNIEETVNLCVNEVKFLRQENLHLKQTIKEQDARLDNIERDLKRKNLIIKGVADAEEEKNEDLAIKVENLLEKMGVNINLARDIDEIKRFGLFHKDKKRPILIKLLTWNKKMEILQQAKTLKGTNIWIDQDYTKKVQNERKQLIPYMKQAREQGKKASLKYNKLIINGMAYGSENLESSEEGNSRSIGNDREMNNEENKKRTISERSPESEKFNEQLKKISKHSKKNY